MVRRRDGAGRRGVFGRVASVPRLGYTDSCVPPPCRAATGPLPITGAVVVVSESSAQRYALDPDVRLMLEVRDDSAAAFEELVVRYQARLVRVLEHLVGSRELAEDLTQEVFLRVFRARKQYAAGAKFATWLFTIANNAALERPAQPRRGGTRSSWPRAESGSMGVRPLDRMIARPAAARCPPANSTRPKSARSCASAMESLGERQRLAVLLNKFEGMSYAEIAETMEIVARRR